MSIKNIQIGATETTLMDAAQETAILCIIFCNLDTVTRAITLYAYNAGGTAGDANTIVSEVFISPKDTWIFTGDEKLILDTGDKLTGICDVTNKVTATLSYKVI